jgi:hypothetical protein
MPQPRAVLATMAGPSLSPRQGQDRFPPHPPR